MKASVDCQRGFTLIEVMVALLIAAVALLALSQTLAALAHQQSGMQQRVYANWVAQNVMVELAQVPTSLRAPRDAIRLGGWLWQVDIETSPTPIPGLQRVAVLVRVQGEAHPAARLVTVMAFDEG